MENITLNNNIEMPSMGLGVFRITDSEKCEEVVDQAIKAGYRFIDTAAAYGNEEAVGRGIRKSGISRSELFVSSKLWIPDISYEGAKRAFDESLTKLGLDYLDLYVIHQPFNDYYGAWRALEELYREGKIRAIGVDNFDQTQLVDLITFNKIKPAVNYVEVHPFYQHKEDIDAIRKMGIQPIAWSPFAAGKYGLFKNEILVQIAQKYNKSVGQVILRWLTQQGIAVVAKSEKNERIKENIDIFDFELDQNDLKKISELDKGKEASLAGDRSKVDVVETFLKYAMK